MICNKQLLLNRSNTRSCFFVGMALLLTVNQAGSEIDKEGTGASPARQALGRLKENAQTGETAGEKKAIEGTDDSKSCPATFIKPATRALSPKEEEKKGRLLARRKEKWALRRKIAKKGLRGNAPCLAWIDSDVKTRAVLLCVHGLGLYNGAYEEFGRRMSKLGYTTYAIDVRGFGSWSRAQGREKVNFDACLVDLESTLKVIRRAHPGLPVILIGESMGGALALRACSTYPELIDGLISSVPSGDRFKQKRSNLKVAMHFLAGPNKSFNVGEGVIEQATEKEALRKHWGTDPLARMQISPKELLQFQNFMNQNHDSAQEIDSTPVLIVQGCMDRLVRPEGTIELYNELSTPDKQLALIPSAEHLIFEEGQFTEKVIELVVGWIESHLPDNRQSDAAKATAEKENQDKYLNNENDRTATQAGNPD